MTIRPIEVWHLLIAVCTMQSHSCTWSGPEVHREMTMKERLATYKVGMFIWFYWVELKIIIPSSNYLYYLLAITYTYKYNITEH